MLIQAIEIQNFRGVNGTKTFSFEGKPFVLLAAPNGLGKTTLIDAIEWCLTGNISRLKNAFDTRSTNENEREKNVDGILKNKKASNEAEISVILDITENDKRYKIKRVQENDELDVRLSKVWLNDSEESAINLLPEIADRNFYNFHFCDVQKSIEIQSRKRKDLPDLFSEFITDYSRENSIADNLDLFAEDVLRYKQDLERKRIAAETIDAMQKAIKQYGDTPVIQSYPETRMYTEEAVLLSSLDENMLRNQLDILYKCGYKQAENLLKGILNDNSIRSIEKNLNELANILKTQKEKIGQAIAQELHVGPQNILKLEQRIKRHKEINLTKDNVWGNTDIIIAFKSDDFTEEKCSESKSKIQQLERELNRIKSEIETLSKGNEILDSLSSLVSKEQGLRKYRTEKQQKSENVKCPVCGSERFGQIEQAKILSEAKEYINQHGLLLAEKKKNKDHLENQIDSNYELLLRTCNQILANEIQKDERKKENLVKLQEETAYFFSVEKRLEQIDSQKYTLKQLMMPEYVESVRNELKKNFLGEKEISQKREAYKKILELLGYETTGDESETALVQKIHELANGAPDVVAFSHPLLVRKIVSINSILNNKRYWDLMHKINEANAQNSSLTNQQKELDDLFDRAKQRAGLIRDLVNCLKSEEYSKVGPILYKFYKKLSRINTIEGIQLKQESDLLSIVDESNKNVVNILSNGQLSVFMLAYFFAGIVSRNSQERCKIYFIDDLTACMDDVNMLAFLDLMKYQLLAGDGGIDQIFFASCDERICKLLRYKLNGCDIEFCELKEKEFA